MQNNHLNDCRLSINWWDRNWYANHTIANCLFILLFSCNHVVVLSHRLILICFTDASGLLLSLFPLGCFLLEPSMLLQTFFRLTNCALWLSIAAGKGLFFPLRKRSLEGWGIAREGACPAGHPWVSVKVCVHSYYGGCFQQMPSGCRKRHEGSSWYPKAQDAANCVLWLGEPF